MSKPRSLSRPVQLHLLLLFTSVLLIVIPALNKTPSRQVAEHSTLAAAQFLFLVDTEEYAKSWQACSTVLQSLLPEPSWNERIAGIRGILGPIVERIQHDISYTDTAADVPAGEYVILTFVSRFEFKGPVIETLTLMLSDDDRWQVAGYFLKLGGS